MWRENRTIFIPNTGKDATNIRNWRPITILARLFTAIINDRLRQFVPFTRRQAGFTTQDGCRVNISLLGKALSCMKADSGSVVTILDIAKAFDMIPHAALRQCLKRKGIE